VHHRYQRHRRQIFSTSFISVVDTSGKFATGVNDTGVKFATVVNDTGGKQWEQLANCWQLKIYLKKIFIYMLALLPKGAKKNNENFSD
jgi:hypothetical protein